MILMKQKTLKSIIVYSVTILAAILAAFPFIIVLLTSLKSAEQIYNINEIIPSYVSLDNFYRVIVKAKFLSYFKNSAFVGVVTTSTCMFISVLGAYGFSRFNIIGGKHIRMVILYTRMFPGILLSVPYYIVMRGLNLTNTLAGLILIYSSFSLTFCIWNLKAFFASIPWEIEESAFIDGANRWQAFILVIIPVARPGILATSLFCFLSAWDEFMFANLFITSASKKTVPIGVYSFIGEYSTDWGGLMAAAIIGLIPVIIFFAVVQKNLVTGITAGSVKG